MTRVEPRPFASGVGQSGDRERALFQRFRAGRDPALRDQLVTRYLPMASRIARGYARRQARVPFEDLAQVASIGLIKSVDRFDPAAGAVFVAFAEPTIRGEIFRHFREFTWAVRPPRELQERALQIERVTASMGADLGRPPSPAELGPPPGPPAFTRRAGRLPGPDRRADHERPRRLPRTRRRLLRGRRRAR